MNQTIITNRPATADAADQSRRTMLKTTGIAAGGLATNVAAAQSPQPAIALETRWDKTFPKSNQVDHQKITFHVDLYDQMDKIPFAQMAAFFAGHLTAPA